ncbi:hypothetical protein C2845_PM02G06140 [Panicum miliaceum]|uniref:Uncharacterized protein n=1 Tax=Panicum miliaceum TaxID=4540 RepID=A0A3L6SC76_PANMI|nr:hypothetical protein C2845_PM02G06140 [Panicum miliaceum]
MVRSYKTRHHIETMQYLLQPKPPEFGPRYPFHVALVFTSPFLLLPSPFSFSHRQVGHPPLLSVPGHGHGTATGTAASSPPAASPASGRRPHNFSSSRVAREHLPFLLRHHPQHCEVLVGEHITRSTVRPWSANSGSITSGCLNRKLSTRELHLPPRPAPRASACRCHIPELLRSAAPRTAAAAAATLPTSPPPPLARGLRPPAIPGGVRRTDGRRERSPRRSPPRSITPIWPRGAGSAGEGRQGPSSWDPHPPPLWRLERRSQL